MASCYFLLQQFDDVLVYLSSIQTYFQNDDRFNWNFGVALAKVGRYAEAAQALANVQNQTRRKQYDFIAWSARIDIYMGQANQAWEKYLEMETSANSFSLLLLIANDSYRCKEYSYAAKAFDVLWRLDPIPEYWEGKRGACCGVLQLMIAGKAKRSQLAEAVNLLKTNSDMPQAQFIARVMNKHWLESV
uniref:Uncharacterized protein n=2 Tax=Spongospora subterranea TaxID=70186 RepID=A0A0H5QP54_9EUKA|eukprot:CRZ03382.1 hypothetical protein [Spongospora subterranea]